CARDSSGYPYFDYW
nr:immunoglobulin heavy chain junction region [Mus musculus]